MGVYIMFVRLWVSLVAGVHMAHALTRRSGQEGSTASGESASGSQSDEAEQVDDSEHALTRGGDAPQQNQQGFEPPSVMRTGIRPPANGYHAPVVPAWYRTSYVPNMWATLPGGPDGVPPWLLHEYPWPSQTASAAAVDVESGPSGAPFPALPTLPMLSLPPVLRRPTKAEEIEAELSAGTGASSSSALPNGPPKLYSKVSPRRRHIDARQFSDKQELEAAKDLEKQFTFARVAWMATYPAVIAVACENAPGIDLTTILANVPGSAELTDVVHVEQMIDAAVRQRYKDELGCVGCELFRIQLRELWQEWERKDGALDAANMIHQGVESLRRRPEEDEEGSAPCTKRRFH